MEDFSVLATIWFVLWGLLWGIYFALDGFDFGIGMLIPLIGRGTAKERDTIYQVTGPFWDGNEVWLITAGGVTFAAFPLAYAVLFSSLYTPLLLLLLMLILRGVAAEFSYQWSNPCWNLFWDVVMAVTGFVSSLLLGVAFSNIFRGLPLDSQHLFQGNILNLLHPYALLGGVLFVVMFLVHGAIYLSWRVKGDLSNKGLLVAKVLWPVFCGCFLLYVVISFAWAGFYKNYFASPALLILPVVCLLAFVVSGYNLYFKQNTGRAFICSCIGIITLALTGVMGIYPNLLPSRLDPAGALNLANSASSEKTLWIMLVVALIFVPLVIAYQLWTHHVLAEKLDSEY